MSKATKRTLSMALVAILAFVAGVYFVSAGSSLFGNGNIQPACALFLKGLGYYLNEDFQAAVKNLKDALNLDARFALARAYLGLTYLEQGHNDDDRTLLNEAIANCQSAMDIEEELQVAHICLGEASLKDEKTEEALEHFERANHLGPFSEQVLNRLRLINTQLGRRDANIALVKEAADRQPQFWVPLSFFAFAYFEHDRLEEAVRIQEKLVELAPEFYGGFINLAAYYDDLDCVEQALSAYERALEIDRNARVYTNLATTHFFMGQYREALEYARQGIVYLEEDPDIARTYIDRGNLADILYWSPGGDSLVFTSNRSGNDDLWKVPITGGTPFQLTINQTGDYHPCWSPTASVIASC